MGGPAAVADDDDVVVDRYSRCPPDVNMDDDNDDKEVEDVDAKKMTTAKQVLPTENKGAGAAIAYGDYDSEDDEEDAELALRAKLIAEWKPDSGFPWTILIKRCRFTFWTRKKKILVPQVPSSCLVKCQRAETRKRTSWILLWAPSRLAPSLITCKDASLSSLDLSLRRNRWTKATNSRRWRRKRTRKMRPKPTKSLS